MDYITTTELRTKTSDLVAALSLGKSIDLIHRSKIIGTFKPAIKDQDTFNGAKLAALAKKSAKKHQGIPKDRRARDKIYRQQLLKSYA